MNHHTRRMIVALPLVLLLPRPVEAQRRSVRGIVSDQNGKSLAGASVKLKTLQTLGIRSYVSSKNGSYRFHGLNPNWDYELWADFGGASSPVATADRFASSSDVVVDLRIDLSGER